MKKTASISKCGKYRFDLQRIWDESKETIKDNTAINALNKVKKVKKNGK